MRIRSTPPSSFVMRGTPIQQIEHVWDQRFEGLTNIVDVYVRHLRGKVDDPFPTKLIRTVRGAGYCIGPDEP